MSSSCPGASPINIIFEFGFPSEKTILVALLYKSQPLKDDIFSFNSSNVFTSSRLGSSKIKEVFMSVKLSIFLASVVLFERVLFCGYDVVSSLTPLSLYNFSKFRVFLIEVLSISLIK